MPERPAKGQIAVTREISAESPLAEHRTCIATNVRRYYTACLTSESPAKLRGKPFPAEFTAGESIPAGSVAGERCLSNGIYLSINYKSRLFAFPVFLHGARLLRRLLLVHRNLTDSVNAPLSKYY